MLGTLTKGWRTSEFWVTVAASVGFLAASLAGSLPPKWAAVLISVSTVAYKLSRGLAKLKAGTKVVAVEPVVAAAPVLVVPQPPAPPA